MARQYRHNILAVALLLVAGIAMVLSSGDRSAFAEGDDGEFLDHPSVVPSDPVIGYPRILDTPTYTKPWGNGVRTFHRQTYAIDMINDFIVSGGDFLDVELQDGTVLSQPNLAVFDSVTKQLACPGLVTDREVRAVVRGHEPNTAIIGGAFTSVTGANGTLSRGKIAKIRLDTCEVDEGWRVQGFDGKVQDLAITGDRLFVAGDFLSVEGQPIAHLAEVSLKDATLNPGFAVSFTGGSAWRKITTIGTKGDGSRLAVIGKFTAIDGVALRGTAIFDITDAATPTLTAHRLATTAHAYVEYNAIRGGSIAPDFSYLIITKQGHPDREVVTQVPTTEAAGQLGWQHRMRDSLFSAAASNNAVYVGGHFCRIDVGPGNAVEMTPNVNDWCTGSNPAWGFGVDQPGVWRTQLAALDPLDGTPLEWNPGTQALVGTKALTVVNRGLLMGQDGVHVHSPNPYMRVGTTAFFDFGPIADARDNQVCDAVVNADDSVSLNWTAVAGVSSFDVLRGDAELATTNGTSNNDTPGVGTWDYSIRSVLYGVVVDVPCSPTVTIAPFVPTCTAVVNADDSVTLTWDSVPGETEYQLRRNGAWLLTLGNVVTVSDSPGVGTWSYEVRYWDNGAVDVPCSPSVTIDPQAAPTCAAVINGDGSVTLTWDAVAGETEYQVRRDGAWIATLGDVQTTSDTPGVGTFSYEVRYWQAGANDIACAPTVTIAPGAAPACAAVVEADGSVTLTWDAVAGETEYQVRRDGTWIATLGDVQTTSDTPGVGTFSYEIRYWQAGANDIACTPTVTIN